MKIYLLILSFIFTGLVACSSQNLMGNNEPVANTGSGILVIADIVFSKKSNAGQTLRSQCDLSGRLAGYIETNAAPQYARITRGASNATADAYVLTIEIPWAVGKWGRGLAADRETWNGKAYGPRSLGIAGTLTKNGIVVGDFQALRQTTGGLFGDLKGSCAALWHDAKALGIDVAKWLQNPAMGSRIADF